jgi:hypothetical protein
MIVTPVRAGKGARSLTDEDSSYIVPSVGVLNAGSVFDIVDRLKSTDPRRTTPDAACPH